MFTPAMRLSLVVVWSVEGSSPEDELPQADARAGPICHVLSVTQPCVPEKLSEKYVVPQADGV